MCLIYSTYVKNYTLTLRHVSKIKPNLSSVKRVVFEYILIAGQFYCERKVSKKRISINGYLAKIDTGVRI